MENESTKTKEKFGLAMRRIDNVRTVKVIIVEYMQGEGVEGDPVRRMFEYWTLDGERIATIDTTRI